MAAAPKPPDVTPAAVAATQRLRLESASAEVLRAFSSAGVKGILLKGASITSWLYEDGDPRVSVDCDVLVRPTDRNSAGQVLTDLGFEPNVDERAMPSWWQEHAVGWLRHQDGAIIDLHRTLPGVGVDPERLWETLSADVETVIVAGFPAPALAIPARAFHLAIHVAQHGGAWGVKLSELDRALSREDEDTWVAAAELAERLEATGAFATGLRMIPAGHDLAARLELPTATPVDVALRARSAPPVAAGFHRLARAENLRVRLAILRHKLFPPRTFMPSWSPLARRGRVGLMLAYAWRPLWLIGRAPAGYRAWRSARRGTG